MIFYKCWGGDVRKSDHACVNMKDCGLKYVPRLVRGIHRRAHIAEGILAELLAGARYAKCWAMILAVPRVPWTQAGLSELNNGLFMSRLASGQSGIQSSSHENMRGRLGIQKFWTFSSCLGNPEMKQSLLLSHSMNKKNCKKWLETENKDFTHTLMRC